MTNIIISRPYHYPDIIIHTNNEALLNALNLLYASFITDQAAGEALNITVQYQDDVITIITDEKRYVTDNPLQEICNFLFAHTHITDDVFAMHAAAVTYQDKAVILAAPTHTGKTTLTTYLIHSGFDYITDDCVFIDKSDASIIPRYESIHLREGGMEVLKKYNIFPQNIQRVVFGTIDRFIFDPPNRAVGRKELKMILFVQRGDANQIQSFSSAECIMELMKSPITPYAVSREYLDFLKKLSMKHCKKIMYKDMEFVSDYIKGNIQ